MEYTNSQIIQRIDSAANWNTNNPTLATGEMAITSDTSVMDFKVGKGAAWQSTDYFIKNNADVKEAKTLATTANNNATTANNNATAASNLANDVSTLELNELKENYSTSNNFLSEFLSKPYQTVSKRTAFSEWVDFFQNENAPTHRLTDAVSWDALFLFMYCLGKSDVITYNPANLPAFLTNFEQNFSTYLRGAGETTARQTLNSKR